jgi:hypothetical protein
MREGLGDETSAVFAKVAFEVRLLVGVHGD